VDKAGKAYWDRIWGTFPPPEAFDPDRRGCVDRRDREFGALFAEALAGLPSKSVVLEAGAADSSVLPHFAKLGHHIVGVDYSEVGCDRLRARLGTFMGEVICCDIFDPPASALHTADLLLSIGLVEHFTDTARCIASLARFVRPGGRVLTIVPNMQGTVGLLQRLVAPSVYEVHVPLSPADLQEAHQRTGLQIERAAYLMATNYGVINYNEPGGGRVANAARWFAVAALGRLSCAANVIDEHVWRLPRRKTFAPYCVVLASVPKGM
jgi:SAM-dependent methyltransferase